jgi:UDP-N-acetylmuramoylalanine--D-glutamate ligase
MHATTDLLRDAPVLILGLGDSGLAMARWCARCGARVTVWDSRVAPPQAQALARAVPAATLIGGELHSGHLAGTTLLLKSPGLAPSHPAIAALLAEARAAGVPVWGELDLFVRALADLRSARGYAPAVLAITGTNGKTTTTAMCAALIARAGRRVQAAGNIGPAMLAALIEALDAQAEADAAQAAADAPASAPGPAAVAAVADPAGTIAPTPSPAAPAGIDANAEVDTAAGHDADADADADAATAPDGDAASPAADDDSAPAPLLTPPPPSAPVFAALPEVWVLELSSFQLEGGGDGVSGFAPNAAALLNLTPDHLDWHGSLEAYAAAKARVLAGSGMRVLPQGDAAIDALLAATLQPAPAADAAPVRAGARPAGRARARPAARPREPERPVLRFGLGAPTAPGDFGLVEEGGIAWLVRALPGEDLPLRTRRTKAAAEPVEIHLQRLMPADALRVRGRHNAANALAALALATAIGCPLAPMLHALRDYAGEPHRLQWLGTVGGVDAYDDSKGTNVGASVAALQGLAADRGPGRVWLLLGGDGKGQDFAPLAAAVLRQAAGVATIGRDAGVIEQAITAAGAVAPAAVRTLPMQRHATLDQAVTWCFEHAQPGDAVLLSPACASWDLFSGYAERGQAFADAVRSAAAERGEVLA